MRCDLCHAQLWVKVLAWQFLVFLFYFPLLFAFARVFLTIITQFTKFFSSEFSATSLILRSMDQVYKVQQNVFFPQDMPFKIVLNSNHREQFDVCQLPFDMQLFTSSLALEPPPPPKHKHTNSQQQPSTFMVDPINVPIRKQRDAVSINIYGVILFLNNLLAR